MKSKAEEKKTRLVQCEKCPLSKLEYFRKFERHEVKFITSFKTGEMTVEPGGTVLVEGAHSAHLFSVLDGWGFRYKMLADGRRQILNYVFPGDLIGLQGSVMGEMDHSVEALSKVLLCIFERDKLSTLFRDQPELAYDITWIAAREERILDENLLSVGRRNALERAAYLIAYIYRRASAVGLAKDKTLCIPITQAHIADTLGLSTVHTNKTLRKLAQRKLTRWLDRGCEVIDEAGLLELAGWDGASNQRRPFI